MPRSATTSKLNSHQARGIPRTFCFAYTGKPWGDRRRSKNFAAIDAIAIAEALNRPRTHQGLIRSEEHLDKQSLHRASSKSVVGQEPTVLFRIPLAKSIDLSQFLT